MAPLDRDSPPQDHYTPSDRSRLKRAHERGAYDQESVFAVFDAAPFCHVGYNIDGQPYVTPTFHWRDGDRIFWHGSSASRMLRQVKTGIPVCVTAAIFDGYVIARSAFHHSANYRSVMAFGTARAIEDTGEKEAALKRMMDNLWPGRWDTLRPITGQELKATTVVAMSIEEAAAKTRSGPPKDDEEDYALDIWAGVQPVYQTAGPIEDDPRVNPGVTRPDHVTQWSAE